MMTKLWRRRNEHIHVNQVNKQTNAMLDKNEEEDEEDEEEEESKPNWTSNNEAKLLQMTIVDYSNELIRGNSIVQVTMMMMMFLPIQSFAKKRKKRTAKSAKWSDMTKFRCRCRRFPRCSAEKI